MDSDEAQKKIREAAEAGRIEFASQDGIEQFQALCDEFLLTAFGIKSAWCSDDTELSDFGCDADDIATIQREYGLTVDGTELLLDVLRSIYIARQPHSTQ